MTARKKRNLVGAHYQNKNQNDKRQKIFAEITAQCLDLPPNANVMLGKQNEKRPGNIIRTLRAQWR